ncbi:MAG: hypothetical protein EU535_05455 [Promethearchaeota archaeon]|nr:MAG: hypothetical protein EU535_05455 [Candidatus Lokiarchaeota archaeon]
MAVTIWRCLLVYVIYVIICIFFAVISYSILKRDIRDRLNQHLALFHLFLVFSLINNFIYASISDPSLEYLAEFLHMLSMYFITVATGFLLLFIILLYNPDGKFSSNKLQILFLLIYNIIGIGSFFIPNAVKVEILPNGTQLSPVWSLVFFIYYLAILVPSIIISMILSFKIYKKFKIEALAKRMRLFLIGLCCIFYMGLAVGLTNFLNIDLIRYLFTLTQAIPIIGVILIYYSVGISLKKNNH